MEVSTFDDDLFDLSDFAKRLDKFIETERHFVQGSLVLALSSKFGSGKTTFLRMWKHALENDLNETGKPLIISLNAWESDYYGDPLFAIVSSLVESLTGSGRPATSLISAAKDVGWFATAIGGQIAKKFTGIDAVAAGDLAEKKKATRREARAIPSDTFSIYEGRKEAMRRLQQEIRHFVETSEPKVLFFVDELDRCRPDYAISYLETIKHIFDVPGAVFLLAADPDQLANSARTAFGRDLDFEEYYRKFIHREVSLPPISDSGYRKLARAYVTRYLERDGLRNCSMELSRARLDNIVELVASMRLTPRQSQEMFRILGHLLELPEHQEGRLLWAIAVGSIAMAAFKVANSEIYHLLGSRQLNPPEACTFLTNLFQRKSSVDWWFALFLTGNGLDVSENASVQEVMTSVGLIHEGHESRHATHLQQWEDGWGFGFDERFPEIHARIEHISQWR